MSGQPEKQSLGWNEAGELRCLARRVSKIGLWAISRRRRRTATAEPRFTWKTCLGYKSGAEGRGQRAILFSVARLFLSRFFLGFKLRCSMVKKRPLVCVSGYFNPAHIGHIRMVQAAAKLGRVVVIVNNDYQVKLKGSIPLMPAKDRAEIMSALAGVEKSVIAIDNDRTVCQTLAKIKPDIFCNGGDRTKKNIPELAVCARFGIRVIFSVGGGKIRSSSTLLGKSKSRR